MESTKLRFSAQAENQFGMSLTQVVDLVRAAVRAKYPYDSVTGEYAYVREIYDDSCVFEKGETYYSVAYSITDGVVSLGEPSRVEISYTPVSMSGAPNVLPSHAYPSFSNQWVRRDAKLFEAGNYPDKGVNVKESDLDAMIRNHSPAPIKIEHADHPFELGFVDKIWRKGKELFGQISLTKEADQLIEKSNAKKLSVGLAKTLDRILETSLVKTPRVSDARIFHFNGSFASNQPASKSGGSAFDVITFVAESDGGSGNKGDHPVDETTQQAINQAVAKAIADQKAEFNQLLATKEAEFNQKLADKDKEISLAQFSGQQTKAKDTVESLIQAGKLLPGEREFAARVLMLSEESVTFSDGSKKPLSETAADFFDSLPKRSPGGETVTGSAAGAGAPGGYDQDAYNYFRFKLGQDEAAAKQSAIEFTERKNKKSEVIEMGVR